MQYQLKERALPYVLFLLCFGSFQAYYLFVGLLSPSVSYVAYGILYSFLLLLFLFFVLVVEESSLSKFGFITFDSRTTLKTLGVAVLLVGIYSLVTMEPGFVFGFTHSAPPSALGFGFFLFASPIVAIAEESVYRGYIFRKLAATQTLTRALLLSSFLYAMQVTNPLVLKDLGLGALAQYLFLNTFSAFSLGIAMCLYFYKSGWSLLGAVVVRTGLILQGNLSPILANTTGWEFTFVFELMGFAGLIIMINALVREPKFAARRYLGIQTGPKKERFLRRTRVHAQLKGTLMRISVTGVIIISAFVGLQYFAGSTVHFSAIASGSMRPTLGIGSIVIVRSLSSPSQVHPGDVVEYRTSSPNSPIVHRVIDVNPVSKTGISYITKGDNNTAPDPAPVPYSNVVGKVVYAIPYLGFLVLSPPFAVALIAFLFISSLLGSSFRTKNGRTARWREE